MPPLSISPLGLIAAFVLKHYICDFPLQRAYQWRNKGTYGHPGGLMHAGIHMIGTFCVLILCPLQTALLAALVDGFVHYHIDWLKMTLNRRYHFTYSSDAFWNLLGADQMLHMLTYVVIVMYISGN